MTFLLCSSPFGHQLAVPKLTSLPKKGEEVRKTFEL
eukprot:13672.XXX_570649_570756_1 [CDS] Oithona nana genome sequencing.